MTQYKNTANVYDFWNSPRVFKLFKIILSNPGKSVTELMELNKTSQSVTSLQLACLRNNDVIEEKKDWKTKRIFVNKDFFKKSKISLFDETTMKMLEDNNIDVRTFDELRRGQNKLSLKVSEIITKDIEKKISQNVQRQVSKVIDEYLLATFKIKKKKLSSNSQKKLFKVVKEFERKNS